MVSEAVREAKALQAKGHVIEALKLMLLCAVATQVREAAVRCGGGGTGEKREGQEEDEGRGRGKGVKGKQR